MRVLLRVMLLTGNAVLILITLCFLAVLPFSLPVSFSLDEVGSLGLICWPGITGFMIFQTLAAPDPTPRMRWITFAMALVCVGFGLYLAVRAGFRAPPRIGVPGLDWVAAALLVMGPGSYLGLLLIDRHQRGG